MFSGRPDANLIVRNLDDSDAIHPRQGRVCCTQATVTIVAHPKRCVN